MHDPYEWYAVLKLNSQIDAVAAYGNTNLTNFSSAHSAEILIKIIHYRGELASGNEARTLDNVQCNCESP